MDSSNAKNAREYSKKLKNMSDEEYAKWFDDDYLLRNYGGVRKARLSEIKEAESDAKRYDRYVKDWTNIYNDVKKMPNDIKNLKKEYRHILVKRLNRLHGKKADEAIINNDFFMARVKGAGIGSIAGTMAGYGAAYAGKKLAYKIIKSGGKLNPLGEFVAGTDPKALRRLSAIIGAKVGAITGKVIGGRVSAAKNKQDYKILKERTKTR